MDIVPLCPLRVSSIEWRTARGGVALTIVVKATVRLVAGESRLADEQDRATDRDKHLDDNPGASLVAATDLVPFKPRADVLIVGSAHAPRGEPARSVVARVSVGELDKSIEVFGKRTFGADGRPSDPAPFERAPLTWERAAAGPGNPVGARGDDVPSLVPVGLALADRRTPVEPVGFGPIAPSWPGRVEKLNGLPPTFLRSAWNDEPLPAIDPGFFNAAPRDQQLAAIKPNETIVLENLRPGEPHFVTRLPAFQIRCYAERPGAGTQEIPLNCDTLVIDTDRGVAVLTWRGQLPLAAPKAQGRVFVALEQAGQRLEETAGVTSLSPAAALPFVRTAAPAAPPVSAPQVVAPPPIAAAPAAPPMIAPPVAAPPMAAPITASPQVAPPPAFTAREEPASPWGVTGAPAASPRVEPPSSSSSPSARWAGGPATPSVRGASDEAAVQTPWTTPRAEAPPAPRQSADRPVSKAIPDILHLLWFKPDIVPKLRRKPAWKKMLDALEYEPADADLDDGGAEEADDQRDVFQILARGEPIDGPGIFEAFSSGVRPDGKFVPPLALASGDIELPFDELETLKATVAVVTPLVGADKGLKETLDAINEVLATPGLKSSSGVEGLTQRLRDAFSQGKRALPQGYLDTSVERMLLEQRHYQKRVVFGEPHLRALFRPAGGDALPVYLPEALGPKLPIFQRFKSRVLAEVCPQEDQYESSQCALRAVGLARVISMQDPSARVTQGRR